MWEEEMAPGSHLVTAFFALAAVAAASGAALAQKHGGTLRQYMIDSPASMSIHEETTVVAERPMMGVFNNLVMFDQHIAQNSAATIIPDLATDWAWDEDGTRLTFHALLASGMSPVYPCHVSPAQMRQHPTGTGPFKFVEFKPNEHVKVARNSDYWKSGRPYLDGIEYTVIPNRSTAILSFIAGKFDMTFPFEVTVPLLRDVKSQAPQAICEL